MNHEQFVNDVFLPNLTRGEFDFGFIAQAVAFEQSGEKIGKSERLTVMLSKLRQSLGQQKEVFPKFIHVSMILCVRLFLGDQAARKDFLAQLVILDPYQIVSNDEAVRSFKPIFLAVFPRMTDALGNLRDDVFGEKFFTLSEKSQKASVFWVMYFIWRVYDSQKEIYTMLYANWVQLLHTAINKNYPEMACFLYFPVFHLYIAFNEDQIGSGSQNEKIEMPLSDFFMKLAQSEKWSMCRNEVSTGRKIKIGFVWHRIVFNAPTKILIALLNCLRHLQETVQVYVYDCESIEVSSSQEACVDMIKATGVEYRNAAALLSDQNHGLYYSVLEKNKRLRQRIIDDQIDVLVCGADFLQPNFLFSTRTAPFQIFWNHGNNRYNVNGIDFRMIHANRQFHKKTINLDEHEFWGFMPGREKQFYDPDVDQRLVEKIKSRFAPGTIILGAICRINKINSEPYLKTVARILKQFPNTVYLACGPGNEPDNEHHISIQKQLKELGIADRFYFEGNVDAAVYGHVLDMFLNTFPIMCGEAVAEFRAKKGIVLSLHPSILGLNIQSNSDLVEPFLAHQLEYQKISGIARMVGLSFDEYVEIAAYFIANLLPYKEEAQRFSMNWPSYSMGEYRELYDQMTNKELLARDFLDIVNQAIVRKKN